MSENLDLGRHASSSRPTLAGSLHGAELRPGLKQAAESSDAPPSAWIALTVLVAVALCAAVDRQILVLIAQPLKESLGLSDARLGMLQGVGLALLVGLASFPMGWLADRYDRRLVLAGCILVWSAATVACGLSQNFWQLMVATMVLGIGEAGLAPVVFGLIPNLFRNQKRSLANAIFVAALGFTAAAAFHVSGNLIEWVGANLSDFPTMFHGIEPWRLSFFLVGISGPILAVMVLALRVKREDIPQAVENATESTLFIPYIVRHRVLFRKFFIGFGLGALGLAAGGWIPIIASRVYGASPVEIGNGMAFASIVGLCAGFLGGRLYHNWIKGRLGALSHLHVMWVGFILAACLQFVLPFATSAQQLYVLMGTQVGVSLIGTMSFPTVVQDMSPDFLRSRMIAISAVVVVSMQAAAPILVGVISDQLASVPNGLSIAVACVAGSGLIMGGVLLRSMQASFIKFHNMAVPSQE